LKNQQAGALSRGGDLLDGNTRRRTGGLY